MISYLCIKSLIKPFKDYINDKKYYKGYSHEIQCDTKTIWNWIFEQEAPLEYVKYMIPRTIKDILNYKSSNFGKQLYLFSAEVSKGSSFDLDASVCPLTNIFDPWPGLFRFWGQKPGVWKM